MHAFNYAVLNLDSYIGYSQNYYLYKDEYNRFNTIPWDLNMSFGSFRNTDDISLSLSIDKIGKLDPLQHLYSTPYTPRPLMKNLFITSRYRKMYMAHLRTIIKENIGNNEYFTLASQYQNIIDTAVNADTNKFYSYTDFKNNLTTDAGTTSNKIPGLKSLMDARLAYLSTYPGSSIQPLIADVIYSPAIVAQNTKVWIKAKMTKLTNALLYYRNSSRAPFNSTIMYDDGLHQDEIAGDSIYGAAITASGKTLQYYIWAENDSCGSFSPVRAAYEFYEIQPQLQKGDVVINEIKLNRNNSYTSENEGNWIELFNNTNEDFRLKNIYFSNDSLNLLMWKLKDTIIPSKKYLMLGLQNSQSADSLNVSFSLPSVEGKLFISSQNGTEIDAVSYQQLPVNLSLGRYPNGNGAFVLMNPSFAAYNLYPKSENENFYIYPNPTTGILNYELNAQYPSVKIEIFNTLSQSVFQTIYSYKASSVSSYNTIDIASLAKGIYFLKASWGDNTEITKIIKQ
jgi:hypothetical protein